MAEQITSRMHGSESPEPGRYIVRQPLFALIYDPIQFKLPASFEEQFAEGLPEEITIDERRHMILNEEQPESEDARKCRSLRGVMRETNQPIELDVTTPSLVRQLGARLVGRQAKLIAILREDVHPSLIY